MWKMVIQYIFQKCNKEVCGSDKYVARLGGVVGTLCSGCAISRVLRAIGPFKQGGMSFAYKKLE